MGGIASLCHSSDVPSSSEGLIGVNLDFLRRFVAIEEIEKDECTAKVVSRVIKTRTQMRKVPFVDIIVDGSYDHGCSGKCFGKPTAMISHAWGSSFRTLVRCVEEYVSKKTHDDPKRDPHSMYFLLDIFVINQHQMAEVGHDTHIYDKLVQKLSDMVTLPSEKEMVLALDSWRHPTMLGRMWCLFEIAVANKNGVKIAGSLPNDEKRDMYEKMISDFKTVEDAFTKIDIQHAQVTVENDRAFILRIVRGLNLPGDTPYEGFNALLRGVMSKWLATVNTRDVRLRSSTKSLSSLKVYRPFRCASAVSVSEDAEDAVKDVLKSIEDQIGEDTEVSMLHVCVTVTHASDLEKTILRRLRQRHPKAVVHGLTSSGGVMDAHRGACMVKKALSVFAVSDPDGTYTVASGPTCDVDAVREAVRKAFEKAEDDVSGIPPDLMLSALSPGPGNEERVLKGLRQAFKRDVPVVGGSSADNDLSGSWKQIAMDTTTSTGFSLLLMWPTVDMFVRLVSLHNDTKMSGTITKIDGSRTIVSIDNKPAAEVYNDWTNGSILTSLGGETLKGNVLAASTCFPLGKYANNEKETKPSLIHPANVENGRMDVFADVREGERLVCMNASEEQLIESVSGVMSSAVRTSGFVGDGGLNGALVIYCGGMMMKIGEKGVKRVAQSISSALGPRTPWTGSFTFGEQGPIPREGRRGSGQVLSAFAHGTQPKQANSGHGNCHGNLMFNFVLFGEESI